MQILTQDDHKTLNDNYELIPEGRHLKKRYQAFRLLYDGMTIKQASRQIGVSSRTVQRWIYLYRTGGLAAVMKLGKPGHASRRPTRLSPEQVTELVDRWQREQFRTLAEAVTWVQEQWGIAYTVSGLHALLRRNGEKSIPLEERVKVVGRERPGRRAANLTGS